MIHRMFIEGEPKGKGRPRFAKGRVYTPRETAEYEKRIAAEYDGKVMDGMIFVDIGALFRVPKSFTKKKIEAIKDGLLEPQKKPDADNIAKVVLDALNGVAYNDDKQVVDLRVRKRYSFTREGLDIVIGEYQ